MKRKADFLKKAKEASNDISRILRITKFQDELARQVYGAFMFGVLNALAYEMGKSPTDVQGMMIELSIHELGYETNQAVEFCQYVINCTDRENNPTTYAIIHRGMEGYYQLKEKKEAKLITNYEDIIKALKDVQTR